MPEGEDHNRDDERNPDSSIGARSKTGPTKNEEVNDQQKKPSKLKSIWAKTGLTLPTILMMIKAAIPPTIAIAIYQSTDVADLFTTLGYLVAIASILGFCIMPRAVFLQTMIVNVFAICFAAALQLLALWSSIQARLHTTPPGASPVGYNSSASVVCATWLFFEIYLINSIKSARPQLMFPVILCSIYVNISMIYGPSFPTMAVAEAFIRRLLIAFLSGFGLSTGVSLFFIPVTSRTVVFKEMTGYLGALRGLLQAQKAYMNSLAQNELLTGTVKTPSSNEPDGSRISSSSGQSYFKHKHPKSTKKKIGAPPTPSPETIALKKASAGLVALHSKLRGDLIFGKRETAWGKLDSSDISEIFRLFQRTLLPLVGFSSIMDIVQRVAEFRDSNPGTGLHEQEDNSTQDAADSERKKAVKLDWEAVISTLTKPMSQMVDVLDQGFEHVLIALEFQKPSKKGGSSGQDTDVEAAGETPSPGTRSFPDYFDRKSQEFYDSKQVTLMEWCDLKGIKLPADFFETSFRVKQLPSPEIEKQYHEFQRQLFVVLYMEYLVWSSSRALFDLIRFAELKIASGTMTKNRLISPGWKRVKKWAKSVFKANGATQGDHDVHGENPVFDFGDSFHRRKDPEHLPPENASEKLGNIIRTIPKALRSEHSVFGFRVACATMSVAIVSYLKSTQSFFNEQRLVWAMIMVAISMSRTAGQSLFNFLLRIFGTAVAMAMSLVIWYIVDGHTAGVIVFLFLWLTCAFYVVIKIPKFAIVGILSGVTTVLIIGYELQVQKIGLSAATSNGQPFYPVYELAPYRLATVAGGLAVAYIWTIFPYPINEHSELRRELGTALYVLANYYSVIHETVSARIRGDEGNVNLKGSPGHQLEKIRSDLFAKEMGLISVLKTYSTFEKWQFSLGGKWPKDIYDGIIRNIETILFYITLVGYASSTYAEDNSQWNKDFKKLLKYTDTTTHDITSTLALLASSVSSGRPLPPYIRMPEPYKLVKNLEALDRDILSIRHIAEPGYAAFAVMQIGSQAIIADLHKLADSVKDLVGELDFSFHLTSATSSSATSTDNVAEKDESAKTKKA